MDEREKRTKVLVVDDDVVSRMVLMHLIDSCGSFEIHEAGDGEDAWRQLAGGLCPQICFCDLRMPRLSGMELLQRVKADTRLAALQFVLVSSAADRETVDQAAGLGADGYIVKPFQADQVCVHLDALSAAPGDEDPAATIGRLGIDAPRLVLYLGGLHRQLVAAGAEIEQQLACADAGAALAHIARLREGCSTLGLGGAAAAFAALEALAPPALDAAQVSRALDEARAAALRQGERARALGS
jgi:two-component system chemotaxis response regulator CheY